MEELASGADLCFHFTVDDIAEFLSGLGFLSVPLMVQSWTRARYISFGYCTWPRRGASVNAGDEDISVTCVREARDACIELNSFTVCFSPCTGGNWRDALTFSGH